MLKWINKKRNKKGFTLVELVVVIAILGILAAIAVPRLTSSRTKAAVSAHNANVRTLEGAATMRLAEEGNPTGDTAEVWTGDSEENQWKKYLQTWPTVPKGTGLTDIEDKSYNVTITKEGVVTVSPKIIELDKDGNPVEQTD